MLLNVTFNLNYPAPQEELLALFKPSPEILVVMSIVCAAAWLGLPFTPAAALALTLIVLFLRLFRLGDVLMPMYFNRVFNLHIDTQFIPDLLHLLYNTLPLYLFICYVVAGFAAFAALAWTVYRALLFMYTYFLIRSRRRVFTAVTAGLLLLSGIQRSGIMDHAPTLLAPQFSSRVIEELDFILHVQGYRTHKLAAIHAAQQLAVQTPASLDRLAGAHVYQFFVESYGEAIFADAKLFALVAEDMNEIEHNLRSRGFAVCSNFLSSPTYGGSSWLAHASIAGGVQLVDQLHYNLLITSNTKPLAQYFNEAGYRTVRAMPGTQWPWPEGEYYRFQKKYYAWHFPYKGPQFGWAIMPDQYVLKYIFHQEIQAHSRPLFLETVLVSSHAPFHHQPVYLQDWSRIGDGSIYHVIEPIRFPIVWPDLSRAAEAYATSIRYDWQVLETFMHQYVPGKTLVIIMGDHQPNVQISGPHRPWSVPVHVASRDPALLEPFLARGYTPGLIPRQPLPHVPMGDFLVTFLKDFSSDTRPKSSQRHQRR